MEKDKVFQQEEQYLEKVNTSIDEEIKAQKIELKEIPKKYTNILQGDAYLVEILMTQCATRIYSLNNAINSPYFGKFVFVDENGVAEEFCIGKTYLKDSEGQTLITDWRAPISSLFYSNDIGPAKYEAPIGVITGNLTSKKQIVINNRVLEKVFDTNFASNDEILQSYLNTHADNRMKDIIASIQNEQNKIIRLPLDKNIIVQGIAGSGKTSIALHRLAYLIYVFKEKNTKSLIASNQFLILGPNDCFLDYISEVLPNMDIDNVTQRTYLSLISSELNTKYQILDNNEVLGIIEYNQRAQEIAKFKNSPEYIQLIESFMKKYIDTILSRDLVVNDKVVISGETFKNRLGMYNSNLEASIKDAKKFYVNSIKENYLHWLNILTNDLIEKARSIPKGNETKTMIYELINKLDAKCKNGFKTEIDKYFAPLLFNPVDIYKIFIESLNEFNNPKLKELKKSTLKLLKKKKITRDDLIGIMKIKSSISKSEIDDRILHVVIDESQDYSKEEFKLLKEMFPKATFSIFGDLSQSIYQYRSIKSWEDISSSIFGIDNIIRINRSYRTTDEIIKEADKISALLNNEVSLENVRHGNSVNYEQVSDSDIIETLEKKVQSGIKKGYKSIAIICKTEEDSIALFKKLCNIPNLNIVTSTNNTYHGGICIIPATLSKGLEFDYVIINDADSMTYNINDRNNLALLYVAMTRALHQLDVTYKNKLFEPLSQSLVEEKKLTKS